MESAKTLSVKLDGQVYTIHSLHTLRLKCILTYPEYKHLCLLLTKSLQPTQQITYSSL